MRYLPPNFIVMMDNNEVIVVHGRTPTEIDSEVRAVDKGKRPYELYISEMTGNVIEKKFLYECAYVTSMCIMRLPNITSIRDGFLRECTSLTSIDLQGLKAVTSIGRYFLSGCASLTSIDLRGLNGVTSIGKNFLYQCPCLKSLGASEMASLSEVLRLACST